MTTTPTNGETPQDRPSGPPRGALKREEAAAYLGISVRKLDQLKAGNAIPYAKIGSRVVFPVAALDRWLADRTKGGTR
jgi:excisionase family DNA binding protein